MTEIHPKTRPGFILTILAMNNQGYQNLMELSTLAHLEGMYYRPRIDHELLEKYGGGLIILSGCSGGEVAESLKVDNYQAAKEVALWYKSVFGDRYYLEMQNHDWDVQVKINTYLQKLSKEIDVHWLLATTDTI